MRINILVINLTLMNIYVKAEIQHSVQDMNKYLFIARNTSINETHSGWPITDAILEKTHLEVWCPEPNFKLMFPKHARITWLHIHNCVIPNTPLAKLMNESDIDYTDLEIIHFIDTFMEAPFQSDYIADLSAVQEITFHNVQNFHAPPEFFILPKLKHLIFILTDVPLLPITGLLPLEKLVVNESSVKVWDNCESLRELYISGVDKTQVPDVWPDNCTKLKTLQLEALTPGTVQHIADSFNETSLVNLETLSLKNDSLIQIPQQLMMSRMLSLLDLSDNKLEYDSMIQIPMMNSLKILDVSSNRFLRGSFLRDLQPKLPILSDLRLSGISIFSNEVEELKNTLAKFTQLEKLYLDRINIDRHSFMGIHFERLKYLSWTVDKPYKIEHLKLYGFPTTTFAAERLEINLQGTSAKYISIAPDFIEYTSFSIERTKSWLFNNGYKLIVKLNSVDCECKNDELAGALQEYPHFLAMPDLKCSHGGLFKDEPNDNLACRTAIVNGCKRRNNLYRLFSDVVDCSYNSQFRWPRPKHFRGLNASGNHLKNLDKAYLPDSLEWLDLSNNSISKLSREQSAQLFGNKGRRVRLSGNPIACNCDNQPLLDALQVNQSLVEDYDRVTCADSDKPLSVVSVAELCRPRSVIVSASLGALAVLALLAALLVRHYWNTIRMLLFARGLCLSCFSEEDLDHDRPYDAFLSFAHGDDEYAMNQLLPKLEGKPNYYRLCVHYRDWTFGQWIPAQIMQSVRLSKRTIIVMSKNFVKSCWGLLEFRHAHADAMAEGRQRLLVLILDEVLDEPLPPELQAYLEFNTYLRCDDPWFWEKLCYAMPHKSTEDKQPYTRFMPTSRENRPQMGTHSYLELQALSIAPAQVGGNENIPSHPIIVEFPTE